MFIIQGIKKIDETSNRKRCFRPFSKITLCSTSDIMYGIFNVLRSKSVLGGGGGGGMKIYREREEIYLREGNVSKED